MADYREMVSQSLQSTKPRHGGHHFLVATIALNDVTGRLYSRIARINSYESCAGAKR